MESDGLYIRMAEPCDCAAVEASFRSMLPRLRAAFGFLDFCSLIEHSLYPLVGLTRDNEVVAFAAFNDAPTVPGGVFGKKAVEAKAWAAKEASNHGYSVENSLWVEACVALPIKSVIQENYFAGFLKAVFKLSPETRVVLDLSPFEYATVLKFLKPLSRSQDMDLVLSMCLRSTVLPAMTIKQAIVKDYDDLFPVVDNAQKKSSPLSNLPNSAYPLYPFAMARLIAAQDAENKVLVAEVDHKLIGVMSLTNKLDFKILSSIRQDALLDSAPIEVGQDVEDTNTMKQDSDMQNDENGFTDKRNSAFKNHEAYVQSSLRNAFEITLFCLLDEFSYSALDFIAGALAFEGKEYCIMRMPHNSPAPEFLQYFTLVKCKGQMENIAEVDHMLLYIIHQKSLANSFEVRAARPQDMNIVRSFLERLQVSTNISHWVERRAKGCMALVASCGTEIIGLALVDQNCPNDGLLSHFDIKQLTNLEQHQEIHRAVLVFFFLNPLFANRQRLFLREIMRLMEKSILFLPVFQGQNVSNMLEDMILVPGRWHASMCATNMWTQASPQASPTSRSSVRGTAVMSATNPVYGQYVGIDCSLFTMTHKLLSKKRISVNSRIVVVGASQTAAACLNKLMTCSNIYFSNVTLISPLGLKSLYVNGKSPLDAELGPVNAILKMGINLLVNIVTATVTDLDRKMKIVSLSNGKNLHYDYLVLTIGLQDQTRDKIKATSCKGMLKLEDLAVLINENALNISKLESPIVVYGLSLQTFCTIQLLLSSGIPGSSVVVVYPELEPLDTFAEQCFKDGSIAASTMKELRAAGVIERSAFRLLEIIPDEEGCVQAVGLEKLFRASVSSSSQSNNGGICIKQPCKLLVTCTQPHVDQPIFRAIRKEGLVFNGRIVVDGNFQTNDPNIFACGSCAMFSRQCGKHLNHELFNSNELGQALANSLISLFIDYLPCHDTLWRGVLPDPFETLPLLRTTQTWPSTLLPRLIQAKCLAALLPENWVYFNVKKCTLQSKYNTLFEQPWIMRKDEWQLKVQWTEAKEIKEMTYYGKVNLEAWKFIRLVGCHDPLIFSLLSGNSKAMTNITNFFSHPWFTLIFHDKFLDFYSRLCLEVYQLLNNAPESQKFIQDYVKDAYVMFLNAYRLDFPSLNFTSSWFSSTLKQTLQSGVLHTSGAIKEQAKVMIKKEDDSQSKERNQVVGFVVADGERTAISDMECGAGNSALPTEGRTLTVREELEIAVGSMIEQLISEKHQLELVVENLVQHVMNSETEIKVMVDQIIENLSQIIEGAGKEVELIVGEIVENLVDMVEGNGESRLFIEPEVRHVVAVILEKLARVSPRPSESALVRVRFTVLQNENSGVVLDKILVRLDVDAELPRALDTNIHRHPQDSDIKVMLHVIEDDASVPVRVHLKYPHDEQRAPSILPPAAEKLVKLVMAIGKEGNVKAVLMPNERL